MANSRELKTLKDFPKNWLLTIAALVGILLIGLLLRRNNLLILPVFADEAIYVRWAQIMKAEPTLRFVPLQDGKQPFFMWVTMPLLKFFSDPLLAGRSVSVFMGLISIVGIFLLTYELFKNKKAALIASFFAAVSPFMVFFDRMALVDSMLTAFSIFAMYFAVLTARTMRLDLALFTGFALGFAWLTKSPAMFFVGLLPTTALLTKWPEGSSNKLIHLGKLVFLWSISATLAFGMYNVLRLGPSFHMISLRNKDYVFGLSEALKHPLDPFQFHLIEIGQWTWALLPATVLLASAAGIIIGARKYWREILFLLAWTWGPLLVIAEIAKVFTARYMLYTIPPFFILASIPFLKDFKWLKNKNLVWALIALIAVPGVYANYKLSTSPETSSLPRRERSGYLEEWTAGQGIREIAVFLKEERTKLPEDKNIIVGSEGFFGTPFDGLLIYLEKVPGILVKGVGISISEVDESLVAAKKEGDKVYLVVNSTRLHAKPENIGLQLVKAYPKAVKPNGSREELLFLEVTDEAVRLYDLKKDDTNSKEAAR